jgi:hypothetical protein
MLVTMVKDAVLIESDSQPDLYYGVVETVQGQVLCTCPAYRYSKYPWSCKHTERYKAEHKAEERQFRSKQPRRRRSYGEHR